MEKIALTPRSKELIKNYLIGGAAMGGSAALLTSLVNYINTLKQQIPSNDEENDENLYINVGKSAKDSAGASDFAAGGIALTGGLLSTLGTYALVRKLYQDIKRKQLQEQLDSAQQEFIQAADAEGAAKKAGDENNGSPMSLAELSYSVPVAFTLLSALAAGALTNKALDKTFPRLKKPKNNAPKRIVIRKAPNEDSEIQEEEKNAYDKLAAKEQYEDGLEFLMHLCMGSKSAAQSELVDIVHAVAQGRGPDLTNHILEYGFDSAMDTIKGASEVPADSMRKQTAIGYCVKSAVLNPIVSMLASAEYNDMAPKFTKIASMQNEECASTLLKIAGVIGALNRVETLEKLPVVFELNKKAGMLSLDNILELVNKVKDQTSEEDDIEQNEDLNSEDSIDSGEEKQVNDRKPLSNAARTPDVINELDEQDDFIDEAMSSPITPAKAVAAENK